VTTKITIKEPEFSPSMQGCGDKNGITSFLNPPVLFTTSVCENICHHRVRVRVSVCTSDVGIKTE